MSKYHMTSYDVWLDATLETQNKISELSSELEEIHHQILDEYLGTKNQYVRDELLDAYKKTKSELCSKESQLEYLNLMDKVKYNLLEEQLDKIKTHSNKKNDSYKTYQDCKKMWL